MKRKCFTTLLSQKGDFYSSAITEHHRLNNSNPVFRKEYRTICFLRPGRDFIGIFYAPKNHRRLCSLLWETEEVKKIIRGKKEGNTDSWCAIRSWKRKTPIQLSSFRICLFHFDGILSLTHSTFRTWHHRVTVFSMNRRSFWVDDDSQMTRRSRKLSKMWFWEMERKVCYEDTQ